MRDSRRLAGGQFRHKDDEEQEDVRRVSRRSIIHRSLSRSKTGGRQDERSEMMEQQRQLGHTLSDVWPGEVGVQYSSLSRDIICGSLLRGKRHPPVSHKSMERRPAEHHKAILEDAPNIAMDHCGHGTLEAKPRVSLRRLSRMTSCHHLPRLPTRPLAGSLRSSSCSSLSQASSSASRPIPILLTSSSTSSLSDREEMVSLAHIDQNLIVHSYVASRGQREKEVEIYEHLPACRLVRARNNLRLGSVSVC